MKTLTLIFSSPYWTLFLLQKNKSYGDVSNLVLLILLFFFSISTADYAPSPQNPFVNTTYPPPPPSGNKLPSSSPSSSSCYTTKVVFPLVVSVLTTILLGIATWALVKYYHQRTQQRATAARGKPVSAPAAWPTPTR